ncbi:putative Nucleoporin GLE1 [Hibiscus syriacus]|uniref:Nucleoporin GLE1 n=1 Tax=Hibiscus syriacus TaxID=106335 RepID=A0A6A2W995_HIBSY|nr:putative Nucleoporin GLE1 [Hibiscus syriacus]
MDAIAEQIVSMGFNCVRLTWPLFFITDNSLGSLTVRRSFQRLGLLEPIVGIQANNPSIIDATLIEAFQAVVSSLGENNVMVILDNHISKPGWCCGLLRWRWFFRGPKQNMNDWYRYMQKGAEAVHAANPNILVILSGLNYDRDLSFIQTRPLTLTFNRKLVFELHWYGFSDGDAWVTSNPNRMCGKVIDYTMKTSGFLVDAGYPLLVSEFGIDIRGTNVNDNRYLNCFLGVVAELDLDWARWTLVGSYYVREGTVGFNEYYGILDWNWIDIRNSRFIERISALQSPFRDWAHVSTRNHGITHLIRLLELKGSNLCLQADESGTMAKLGINDDGSNSKWEMISDSIMHISSTLKNGKSVCLDVDSNNNIVMNGCKCLNQDNRCDPGSQWFKLVDSTRSGKRRKTLGRIRFNH